MAESTFDAATLERFEKAYEIKIVRPGAGGKIHETPIWVVTAEGKVLVRSYRGEQGLWFKALRDGTATEVVLDDQRLKVRAVPGTPAEIEATSAAFERKYASEPTHVAPMLLPEVLGTTLRLEPALIETGAGTLN